MEDFHELGYKIYEKYFDESVFQTASNEILKYCFDIFSLTQTLSIGIGVKEGFSEIVQRQLGRYEIKIDISRLPLFCHSYIYDFIEKMNKIPRNIFKDVEFHLIHFSCVISMPGTQSQTWHVDGPHLSLDEYLPCHCFNIFVPFVDLTFDNGPTQIRPKSQFLTRNMKQLFTPALLLAKLESIVTPCLSKGSILVVSICIDYQ